MIPLVNQNTISQRIRAEYEYLQRNTLPLQDFESHARAICILSYRLYGLYRQKVPLQNEKAEY